MKTAIFGGSFDPIHKGHIEIINKLTDKFDKVIVLPNYLNPLKESFSATPEQRIKWIKKSIKNPKVEISDYEIKQNKTCYTINTIKHFLKTYKNITFIIGADNLSTLNKWKDIKELKKLINFIVISRNKIKSTSYETINLNIDISSTKIRENPKRYEKSIPKGIREGIIGYYSLENR